MTRKETLNNLEFLETQELNPLQKSMVREARKAKRLSLGFKIFINKLAEIIKNGKGQTTSQEHTD